MITVRRASEADSEDVFEWLNDEHTRRMSYTTDWVAWRRYQHWFLSSLNKKDKLFTICELNNTGAKVGIVRFDIDANPNTALISIILAPSMRGKGFAKRCLVGAMGFFKRAFPTVSILRAEIKSINLQSRCSFEGVGFILKKTVGEFRCYHYRLYSQRCRSSDGGA